MKVYLAGTLESKEEVVKAADLVKKSGHEIVVEWFNDVPISTKEREAKSEEASFRAVRDLDGLLEADVFILFTDPAEGRGKYVELGMALALQAKDKKLKIYLVGEFNNQSVFYYHPLIIKKENYRRSSQ